MNCNKQILLHLSLIPGIGPVSLLKIIRGFLGSCNGWQEVHEHMAEVDLTQLYHFNSHDFIEKCGLPPSYAKRVVAGLASQQCLTEEEALITKHNINVLTLFDEGYPVELLSIHVPPPILYCKGAPLKVQQNSLAVVGSRKAGMYAQEVIKNLIMPLAQHGWTIISGGARGVDTMAHQAALEGNSSTIVVFGSGLLTPYPKENKKLFADVAVKGGTLVSIFPLRTQPLKGNFPARNRVIAGFASGCLVVAASCKSGAKITAQYALDQGKQVFAVPGSIFDSLQEGCHDLLMQGAKLVANVNDILEEFGLETMSSGEHDKATCCFNGQTSKKDMRDETDPLVRTLSRPTSIDELAVQMNMTLFEIQERLFDLQLEGKVKQNFAGFWERS